jgi:hypothetical protein
MTVTQPTTKQTGQHTSNRLRATVKTLMRLLVDPTIPRPIRWLILVGLLPVPGPFDELILLAAVGLLLATRPQLAKTTVRRVRAIWERP